MDLAHLLLILPDERQHALYWQALTQEGYAVIIAPGTEAACACMEARRFDAVVLDIDEQCPGTFIDSIESLQPRNTTPLIVQGSPLMLTQLLAEFSNRRTGRAPRLNADALVIKNHDITELRLALHELIPGAPPHLPREFRAANYNQWQGGAETCSVGN
jgi:DNA-binding response OmpR family regulator